MLTSTQIIIALNIMKLISYGFTYEQESPKIQPFHFPSEVKMGSKISIGCFALGKKPLTFNWLKNNQNVKDISGIHLKTDEEFSVLTIEPVDLKSIGNYTCLVQNSIGEDKFTAQLRVKIPPQWTNDIKILDVIRNNNLTIQCTADGHPLPTVTLKRFTGSESLFSFMYLKCFIEF
ncbi:limbic system-associated membrane protein-like [Centruroides sculpturatus]|uniref:limbic system-associated membrane protein-like n=1 Tax=Centruroides sculpturatus TaxID=218467 RepID=UPI000C6C994D|nr:limbic system-associated membrane protein-like [Centruroides sculpturatus]